MLKRTLFIVFAMLFAISGLVMAQEVNLAEGKAVWVSAAPESGDKIVDGDPAEAARWSTNGMPAAFVIDLGASETIELVKYYTFRDRAYQYTVEVSTDSTTWTQIVDRSANAVGMPVYADIFTATQARYIRVEITDAGNYTGSWVNVQEFEVYGQATCPRSPLIAATEVGIHHAALSLTDLSNVEDAMAVYMSEDGATFTMIDVLAANETEPDTVMDLAPNTMYWFYAQAEKSGCDVAVSDTISITTGKALGGLAACRWATCMIHVSWTDNSPENVGYLLEYGAIDMDPDSMWIDDFGTVGASDTVMISGLTADTEYWVTVAPYDTNAAGEKVMWTQGDTTYVTTFPMRPAVTGGLLLEEDMTDGSFCDPDMWSVPGKEWGEWGFMAPNDREVTYGFSRRLGAGGDLWNEKPVWGDWDDRNLNGIRDCGEHMPYEMNLAEDILILKIKHFSDIAGSSTEYYNINPRLMGPNGDVAQLKLNYNTKGGNGYNRQVHPMVGGAQYPLGGPAWQLPAPISYGNFAEASDSTLDQTWENLIVFRPEVDTSGAAVTNVEAHTENAAPFDGIWEAALGEDGVAHIDHMDLYMVRPTNANVRARRDGIADCDAQLGIEHMQVGITKKGDFNLDYAVDIDDFFAWASGYGNADTTVDGRNIIITPKVFVDGDIDNDGSVTTADYDGYKSMFGKGEKQDVVHYMYDTMPDMETDHGIVAEINTKTGDIIIRGNEGKKLYGYKLCSAAGGFRYAPGRFFNKNEVLEFSATRIGQGYKVPKEFGTGRDPVFDYVLGTIYNTDVNTKDVMFVYQDELGAAPKIGGVSYMDYEYDGLFTASSLPFPPSTSDPKVFASYAGTKDRRDLKFMSSGGRDLGSQFTIPSNLKLSEITVSVFPDAWGDMQAQLEAAQGEAVFLEIAKFSDNTDARTYEETVATFYGYLPKKLDTQLFRYITFKLPEDGLLLEKRQGNECYGFMIGFVAPNDSRILNLSMTHPNKDTTEVPPNYLGGKKLDYSWKQDRMIDGSWKHLPVGHTWEQELTFWAKASEIGGGTPVEDQLALPTRFDLSQNFPNPFNPTTTITYSLPQASDVLLTIYDSMGRKVKELVSENVGAGVHSVVWDGTNNNGHTVASGVYLYRLKAADRTFSKRMMFIK